MTWPGRTKILRRHRVVLWVVVVTIVAMGVSIYFQNAFTSNQVKTHYLKAFEKKYWAELDIDHAGNKAVISEYFNRILVSFDRLSRRPELLAAVKSNDLATLSLVLKQQRETNQDVTTIFVLNKEGVMIAESSQNDFTKHNVGDSFAGRDYYKDTLSTKLPSTSKVFEAINSRLAITFCAPQLDQGDVVAVFCGGINLDDLGTRLNNAEITSDFASFDEVITDSDGNVILENRQAPAKPTNLKSDRTVAALLSGNDDYKDEIIDYRGNPAFVEASRISPRTGNSILLLTYLPKSEIDRELALLDAALARTSFGNLVRGLLITLGACFLIAWVIRKHDEESQHHK